MAEFVAKISETIANTLLADPEWEYDIKLNYKGELCMDLRDAIEVLAPEDFEEIEWEDYLDSENNIIGIPKAKKKRR